MTLLSFWLQRAYPANIFPASADGILSSAVKTLSPGLHTPDVVRSKRKYYLPPIIN